MYDTPLGRLNRWTWLLAEGGQPELRRPPVRFLRRDVVDVEGGTSPSERPEQAEIA
jgi:hypothetical protein